jgi:hypothetical protein
VLRPTWHFVASGDIVNLLKLTAPRIKAAMKSRDKQLELDAGIYKKCTTIIEKALQDGDHLTREELMIRLQTENINTSDNRSSHILMNAELDGLICSGAMKNQKQTYALLSLRVPHGAADARDEALAKLAFTYFTSHGPATLQDFIWWSGLSVADARHGLEMVKTGFLSDTISGQEYWFKNHSSAKIKTKGTVYILPAYDEFLISYRDRSASLPVGYHAHTVSTNGIFRPIIVADGQVSGLWTRKQIKNEILIETRLFHPPTSEFTSKLNKAFNPLAHFLTKSIALSEANGSVL